MSDKTELRPAVEERTKRCCACRAYFAISFFGKNRAMKDGLNKQCRSCSSTSGRKIRQAARLAVLTYYSGGTPRCACCGEARLEFLSIDHIHGGGKKHIQEIGFNLVRWLKANGLPDGYRVLCHNCNFALGHYGYCPHEVESKLMQGPRNSAKHGGDRKSPRATTAKWQRTVGREVQSELRFGPDTDTHKRCDEVDDG